ncbi:MAG: exopolysaccharide biosynthesis protein [Erythrobacter sp.]
MSQHDQQSVSGVLGELDELAATRPAVCIADVLEDFGKRSFGPFIMLPALMEITPVGGVPGVPSFLAFIIALTALQLLVGRDHVWMPALIGRRSISGKTLHKAVARLRGIAGFLDRYSEGRLAVLTQGVATRVVALLLLLLCCTVPPLEFLPFASSIPMLAIAILGMALTVRDGALVLASLVFTLFASGVGVYMFITFDAAEKLSG